MKLDDLGRLKAIAHRRGAALPGTPDADALAAIARCGKCHYKQLCDETIASTAGDGRAFCPNTHYLAALRERRLAFR